MRLVTKIRIIFAIASLLGGVLFWVNYNIQMKQFQQELVDELMRLVPFCRAPISIQKNENPTNKINLSNNKFPIYTAKPILHDPKIIYEHSIVIGMASIWQDGKRYFFRFENPMGEQWIQSSITPPNSFIFLIWYGITLFSLLALFLWLVKSLAPLSTLYKGVVRIKQGDLSTSVKQNRNDEIAQVANTLDDGLRRIESLMHSRQLFLHAIMHELKTPIAKGKLLNAFLEDSDQKDHYEALFDRLELLLCEFARIEQMLTANYTLKIAKYSMVNLVDHALDLMLLTPKEVEENIHIDLDTKSYLSTDFNLFTLAVKNLIDNALTHSPDHRVHITSTFTSLSISNRGKPLTHPLEAYREPFTASSDGLGLGLYIVLNIAEVIGLKLTYRHEDGTNTFSFRY